jgi:hypothetical protein
MTSHNFVIVAPGHDEFDNRVVRTLNVLELMGVKYHVYYEHKRSLGRPDLGDCGTLRYFNLDINILNLFYYSRNKLADLFPDLISADFVYIHDSGLVGLAIAYSIKKNYPEKTVIFDYHDLINWEIYYQLVKLRLPLFLIYPLYKFVFFIHKLFFSKKISFDYLIGITHNQIINFLNDYNLNHDVDMYSVVPNSRLKIDSPHISETNNRVFLWVGNIRKGRDIESFVNYVCLYNHRFIEDLSSIFFAGSMGDMSFGSPSSCDITYGGRFCDDNDIHGMIPRDKIIGVFMGWDDPVGTSINSIASPNKIYSYLNLGIPVLCHLSLRDVLSSQGFANIIYFDTVESFVELANAVFRDYSRYSSEAILNRDSFENWSSSLDSSYSSFLKSIIQS